MPSQRAPNRVPYRCALWWKHMDYQSKSTPNTALTAAQLGYVAGIIDGEGCIRLKTIQGQPVPVLSVTNTDLRLIIRLQEWFGGYVWTQKQSIGNGKIRYSWQVAARKATAVLVATLPYLLLKVEQAEIVLAVQAMKRKMGPDRGRGHHIAPAEAEARAQAVARIRVLNKKGVA
jgi:hypothetical protein